jgi:hypothetical protein
MNALPPEEAKAFITAAARGALAGIAIEQHEADDGRPEFVANHNGWAMTRRFRTLAELAAWLDRVTGRPERAR